MNPVKRTILALAAGTALTLSPLAMLWVLPSSDADTAQGDLGEILEEHSRMASDFEGHDGNLLKDLGESAALVAQGVDLLSLSVTSITLADSCPSRAVGMEEVDGSFLILDISASLDPQTVEFSSDAPSEVYFPLMPEAFRVYDGDGTLQDEISSTRAWECFADEDLLPPFIFPGEHATGLVVLEITQLPSGSVAYMPGDAPGWEWQF